MTKKETTEKVLNTIVYVCKFGNMPVYNYILKNHKKGYKPAKDFVKKVSNQIEQGNIKTNIDLINYLTNIQLNEIIPYTYTRYQKN